MINSPRMIVSRLKVGERVYLECTQASYPALMRRAVPAQRLRVPGTEKHTYKANLFTAVAHSKAGVVRLLVCVERLS